jgi:hypothetical protein
MDRSISSVARRFFTGPPRIRLHASTVSRSPFGPPPMPATGREPRESRPQHHHSMSFAELVLRFGSHKFPSGSSAGELASDE